MKYVYVLEHAYEYGKNNEYTEAKMLGVFRSREDAEDAITRYKELPGFRDFSDECFNIDKYELNKEHWAEGFIEYED